MSSAEPTSPIALSSTQFKRSWVFWESYNPKGKDKKKYEDANKEIFEWDNLISFYQFMNKYPGTTVTNVFFDGTAIKYFYPEQKRIIAMNIFAKDIKPLWEDEHNKGGQYLQFEYQIDRSELADFAASSPLCWKKLALLTMGESLKGAKHINGIRFVDKTDFERGKIILFRFEVWLNKDIASEERDELIEVLKSKDFLGCGEVKIKSL